MEAIILAGGLGTRLQGVIGAQPKCMAMVNGRPFLSWLFEYLTRQKCTRAILSLGYKHEIVTDWVVKENLPFAVDYVVESEPLGTGGGIQLALLMAQEEDVVVLNGDTMFNIDLPEILAFHKSKNTITTLALKVMHRFDRYGIVNTNEQGCITAFEEKQYREAGMINGGAYVIKREAFLDREFPQKFSFEKDFLEQVVTQQPLYGYCSSAYFIDIGVPDDYAQAQEDFKTLFS
jgi:D-glycero-alpha-D-manno-heptose 1-phosphate guanylyltransferase